MKQIIVDGRQINVFDDLTTLDFRLFAYKFATNSKFGLGWADSAYSKYPYMCSSFSEEDVKNLGILEHIKGSKALELVNVNKMTKAILNLSISNEPHWCHTHRDETVLLYYVNPEWREEWGGETLFMDDDVKEIEFASMYTPGRIIVFDGQIPHTIRPPSIVAPTYRFSLSIFFSGSLPEKAIE